MAKNGQQFEQSGDKGDSGGLRQTMPVPKGYDPDAPGIEGTQSPEGGVVPFSLDEFAALTGEQRAQTGSGQFSGDDLEFESFMFDGGDIKGVQLERQPAEATEGATQQPVAEAPTSNGIEEVDAQAQAAALEASTLEATQDQAPAPISTASETAPAEAATPSVPSIAWEDVPVPSYVGAFVPDMDVPQSPPAFDALQAALANIEELVSGDFVPVPAPLSGAAPTQYPTSVADWSDQMLASVSDFSAVLLALRAGKWADTAGADAAATPEAPEAEATIAIEAGAPPMPQAIAEATAEAPDESIIADLMLSPDTSGPLFWPMADEILSDPASQMIQALAEAEDAPAEAAVHEETPVAPVAQAAEAAGHAIETRMDPRTGAAMLPDMSGAAAVGMSEARAVPAQQADQTYTPEAVSEPVSEAMPPGEHIAIAEVTTEAAAQDQPVAEVQEQPQAEQSLDLTGQGSLADEGLPPWLREEAAASEPIASSEGTTPQGAQSFEPLSQGIEPGDLAAQEAFAADATAYATAESVTDEKASLPGVPESGLSGDDLEFESFMFNEGAAPALPALPNIGEFMPAVQRMEAAIETTQAASAPQAVSETAAETTIVEGSLPFWLQDGGFDQESGQAQASIELEAVREGAPEVEAMPAPPVMTSAPVPGMSGAGDMDGGSEFADLPPIEPFDFSALQEPVEEERLGFNTEELSGTLPETREPMMVTANLDVLADLLERERSSGMLDMRSINLGLTSTRPTAEAATSTASASLADAMAVPGWVTGTEDRGASASTTSFMVPEPPATLMPTSEADDKDTSVADFGISPFDITELQLDARERGTGNLNTGLLDHVSDDLQDKIFTGTLFTKPNLERSVNWEAPDWMGDSDTQTDKVTESALEDKDMETSRFKGGVEGGQTGVETTEAAGTVETNWMGTGLLSDEDYEDVMPQLAEEIQIEETIQKPVISERPSGMFKARVSRFKIGDYTEQAAPKSQQESATEEEQSDTTSDSALINLEAKAGTELTWEKARLPNASGMSDVFDVPAAEPTLGAPSNLEPVEPVPAASTAASVPEPPGDVSGFDSLQEIVAHKPNDVGARMALAVAYAQAGRTDHALNEYHRLLQQRGIPASLLDVISEQIADLESEAGGTARFHQVRGDVLMKQGHFEEAVKEYNKIK